MSLYRRYEAWCVKQSTGSEAGLNCGHRVAIPAVGLVIIAVVCRIYWATVEKVLLGILAVLVVALVALIALGIRRMVRWYERASAVQAQRAAASAARQAEADSRPHWPDKPLERTPGQSSGQAPAGHPGQQQSGQVWPSGPAPAAPDNREAGQAPEWWTDFEEAHTRAGTGRASSAEQDRGVA